MLPKELGRRVRLSALAACATLGASAAAGATSPSSFDVKNVAELVALCSTPASTPTYREAIHFCHGYVVGAYHYYEGLAVSPMYQPLFCPDSTQQPREQFIADFIAWSKAHPEYDKDRAVHILFKYMIEKWPCTREVP
ncbi:Rap1a/Tai family immunity protein [Methylolobus aquaticus]